MRKCEDWLKSYLRYTEGQESPDIYHLWCGISIIAATLERSVYIDQAYWKLYPNLYVVLVGASALSRKSTAIKMVEGVGRVAKESGVELPFISQRITPEKMIMAMDRVGKERGVSAGYAVSDEFSYLLGSSRLDASLIRLLTTAYDCKEVLDYDTVSHGRIKCENSCLNILAGTTPAWLADSLPSSAIGGGFTSRMIFVYCLPSWRRNPFPKLTEEQKVLLEGLGHDLGRIREMKGEYELSERARKYYATWYVDVFHPDDKDPSLRGYYGRKHVTLLKVSMVIAASGGDKLVVQEGDVAAALDVMNKNEEEMPKIMHTIQSTEVGRERDKVLGYIRRKGEIAHSELLRKVSYFIRAPQLEEIVKGLVDSGEVALMPVRDGNAKWYKMKGGK